jgi:hypothetical protein
MFLFSYFGLLINGFFRKLSNFIIHLFIYFNIRTFFVLFGVLGFNEIIILHCCNFEINIIKLITERVTKDEFMRDDWVLLEKRTNN